MTPTWPRSRGRRSCSPVAAGESSSGSDAGYPFAQVYAPSDDDVVAYEPMTAPTNALVAGGPDLPMLEPGGRYEATFSIAIT